MESSGKLIGGMGFLEWGIGRRIRIPIIGAFVCVVFLDGRGADGSFLVLGKDIILLLNMWIK